MHMCSTQDKLQTILLGISYCLLSLNVVPLLKSIAFDDSKRGEYKIKAESVKNWIVCKDWIFRGTYVAQIKNLKLKKDR